MFRIILFAIIIILLAILLCPIKICIQYNDRICVFLKVLFFKKSLYDSNSSVDVKKFTSKGVKKQIDKVSRQIKNSEKTKEKTPKKDIREIISLVNDILIAVKDKFFRYLRINVASLKVIVSTDDAAKTAIEYGVIVQLLQYTVTILQNITNFSAKDNTSIICDVDYTKGKSEFSCDISFTLRVWHILAVALSAAIAYIKNTTRHSRKGEQNGGK